MIFKFGLELKHYFKVEIWSKKPYSLENILKLRYKIDKT